MRKILVTGAAGFIGSNLVDRLLEEGHDVIGIDNFNNYYSPKIKEENIKKAINNKNFTLFREDILDLAKINEVFLAKKPEIIIHLAARAGVRPSLKNPMTYAEVNVLGTVNLLKLSTDFGVKQFIFGSSSSVYGQSKNLPFKEDGPCNNIISPYGSSKKSAEFFVESFYHNFGLKSIILRLFTVYGPRGRPDMAPALFTKAIMTGGEIKQFGDGSSRDYTFIDDVIDGILKVFEKDLDFEIINLGGNNPVTLNDFITMIEEVVGKMAKINMLEKQVGDSERTWASIKKAKKLLDWQPQTELRNGLVKYVQWLKNQ